MPNVQYNSLVATCYNKCTTLSVTRYTTSGYKKCRPTAHVTTQFTPYFVLFGRTPKAKLPEENGPDRTSPEDQIVKDRPNDNEAKKE